MLTLNLVITKKCPSQEGHFYEVYSLSCLLGNKMSNFNFDLDLIASLASVKVRDAKAEKVSYKLQLMLMENDKDKSQQGLEQRERLLNLLDTAHSI